MIKVEFPEGGTGSCVQDELESGGRSGRQRSVSRLLQKTHKIRRGEYINSPKDFAVKVRPCLDRRKVIYSLLPFKLICWSFVLLLKVPSEYIFVIYMPCG